MIWQNTHETPLLHGILDIIKIDANDRKNKNNHSVRPVQKSNRKIVDTEAKSLPSTGADSGGWTLPARAPPKIVKNVIFFGVKS